MKIRSIGGEPDRGSAADRRCHDAPSPLATAAGFATIAEAEETEGFAAPLWSRTDTIVISGLMLAAVLTRFWHLGIPAQIVFDEHFTVSEARCYVHGLPYSDVHPPLPSLCIALSIMLFGDHSWSWRLPGAVLGSALIGITYLLGRRMFNSRLTATLAAGLILCDGLFFVDSRIALWEIFYVTFAACSYLMLFRYAQDAEPRAQRRDLAWTGLALGLSLGSKLLIPVIAFLLVSGSLLFVLLTRSGSSNTPGQSEPGRSFGQAAGVLALVGGLSSFIYLAIFLQNYWFGSWHGVADQVTYSLKQFRYQKLLISYGAHPYASRWWSWPLMLRPILYWTDQSFFPSSDIKVAAIRAFGNPIICWGVLAAVPLAAAHAVVRKNFPRAFLVIGYVLFLVMWIPIRRYQFLYYYMPALYLGTLALADVLAECWRGKAPVWEHALVLTVLAPGLFLGLGSIIGSSVAVVIAAAYLVMTYGGKRDAGRLVCGLFVAAVLVCFLYFFPVWTGLPLSPAQFRARMWLHGAGLANWI